VHGPVVLNTLISLKTWLRESVNAPSAPRELREKRESVVAASGCRQGHQQQRTHGKRGGGEGRLACFSMLGAVAPSPGWANTPNSSANNSFWFSLVCGGSKRYKKNKKNSRTKEFLFSKDLPDYVKKI